MAADSDTHEGREIAATHWYLELWDCGIDTISEPLLRLEFDLVTLFLFCDRWDAGKRVEFELACDFRVTYGDGQSTLRPSL